MQNDDDDYNNDNATPHSPGTTPQNAPDNVTPMAPSYNSDYAPNPLSLNAPHSTAPPPHAVGQSDMALLGLVPLSVFMP